MTTTTTTTKRSSQTRVFSLPLFPLAFLLFLTIACARFGAAFGREIGEEAREAENTNTNTIEEDNERRALSELDERPERSFSTAAPDGDGDFWGKKTIARDLERFNEHCDAVLGSHQERWLKLYETNERVLTIDASCSEHANGIGNYLGDFLAWFAWGMASERAVYVRFTDCGDEEHGRFVEERAMDAKARREVKRDARKRKKEEEKRVSAESKAREEDGSTEMLKRKMTSSRRLLSSSRKLLQREATMSLMKEDDEAQKNQEEFFARERGEMMRDERMEANKERERLAQERRREREAMINDSREETPEEVQTRHEKERESLVEEEKALDRSMEGSALDGSGSASTEAELSQSQRERIHTFENDRHELAERRLKELRRVGGPRPKVMEDLENRERDLAGRTAGMAGADLAMPPIDHRVVDASEEELPRMDEDVPRNDEKASDDGENSVDSSETSPDEIDLEQAKLERENELKQELADRAQADREEEEDRKLREMEHEGENEDWSFLNDEVNHKSQCKEETRALMCKDRANMGLYFQLPDGKSWNLDAKTRKRIFDSIGRGPKQVISPDDFSKSTNETFGVLESMLMNAHPWIEIKLHTSGQDHGLIPGSTKTCAVEGGGESSGSGDEFCADVGQAVIGLGYIRLAKKLEASLFNEPQEGTKEFFHSADYATYENKLAHQKIRGCLWHLTSRPTDRLASVLLPYINKFDEFDAVGAMHIRTGDWSNENTPSTLDQHDGQGTFEEKVASINKLLQNAGTSIGELKTGSAEKRFNALNALIEKGGFTRTNKDPIIDESCPRIKGDYFTLGESNDAGLSPYFTCIGRAAQKAATDRAREGKGKFGIYVSTDSPYLKKLTSELTDLKDIVVGCIGTCEFHHADHEASEHIDPEFDDDVLSDDYDYDYDYDKEEAPPIEPASLGGKNINSKDPFIMSFVDAYILGLTDHIVQVTASTFDMVAQRGFGHGGVPQNLEDNGFTLQGAFKQWSNKHLPICEACGLTRDDMDKDGSACQMAGEAIFGIADDAKFAEMFKSSETSEERTSSKRGASGAAEVEEEEVKEIEEKKEEFTSTSETQPDTMQVVEKEAAVAAEKEGERALRSNDAAEEEEVAAPNEDQQPLDEAASEPASVKEEEKEVEKEEAGVAPSVEAADTEVIPQEKLEALEEIREAQEEQAAVEEAEEVIEAKAEEIIAERGEEEQMEQEEVESEGGVEEEQMKQEDVEREGEVEEEQMEQESVESEAEIEEERRPAEEEIDAPSASSSAQDSFEDRGENAEIVEETEELPTDSLRSDDAFDANEEQPPVDVSEREEELDEVDPIQAWKEQQEEEQQQRRGGGDEELVRRDEAF